MRKEYRKQSKQAKLFKEDIWSIISSIELVANKNTKVLLVTSPGVGEGKSIISYNLAVNFSEQGKKTLLIDANMRKPEIHKIMKVKQLCGLSTILLKRLSEVEDIIFTSKDIPTLDVLFAGMNLSNPRYLLSSNWLKVIMQSFREKYEYIIIDTPSICIVSDTLELSRYADASLLVVKSNKTKNKDAEQAIVQLNKTGIPLLGVVLNSYKKKKISY
ncbi:polysaccharide biosynthesis tyrosine autokinase [Enterococcus faecalis]|nr:polysaccharide biosynthesis tyrosine autokinase [Enterococcus faecalis]